MSETDKLIILGILTVWMSMLYSCVSRKVLVHSRSYANDSLQVKIITKQKNDSILFRFYAPDKSIIPSQQISGVVALDFGSYTVSSNTLQRWNDSTLLITQEKWWDYLKGELLYSYKSTKHTLKFVREIEEDDPLLAPWRAFW